MTEEKQIEEMAEYIHGNAISHDTRFMEDCRSIARDLYAAGYRKHTVAEHICCKDCKYSECCVVQIRTYSEEIAAELHFSDPNNFYCAFANTKGGD